MDIFNYTDYRAYLHDFYSAEKEKNRAYSFRVFAAKAKLGSPNYLKLVMDRTRRITDQTLPNFIRGLRLAKREAEYFTHLVYSEEASHADTRAHHDAEARKLRQMRREGVHVLQQPRLAILRSWHHWAVRELVLLDDFKDDPLWISDRLIGHISAKQAIESMNLLKGLGFIRKEGERYVQSEPLLSTTDDVSSGLIRALHRQFIELGMEAIEREPVGRREVNGLTLAIPSSRLPELRKMIREFRTDLNRKFSSDQGNDEVVHLVINLFPLTHTARIAGSIRSNS